uniref:BMA-NCS-6, isoform f n=1 Tax=Brugia malayi TaxID=6279 RepID=A0A1I9G4A4_BRUMA|nr:BMA-NCS-6, isoform f [Brugia malayi]
MLSIHQLLKNIINLKGFLVMYPPVCRQIVYVNYCIGPVEGYNMEMDVEDLLSNPFNTQPPSLNELIHVTGFNKDWIMFMYRNFKQICSNGRMPLQQWRRIFQLIFPKSANSEFADRVFRAIAGGKTSKHITFEEMDMDNDGIISFDDVKRVLTPECDSMRLFKEAHLLHS